MFSINGIEYTIIGPIEVISDTQLHVETDKGIILCGDTKQDDLTSDRYKEASGLKDMMKVFTFMGSMTTVQFEIDDIVRSGFVRDFIIAENQLGLY